MWPLIKWTGSITQINLTVLFEDMCYNTLKKKFAF